MSDVQQVVEDGPGKKMSRPPAIKFIFVTVVLEVLGFGLIIPIGPDLVREISHGTMADATRIFGYLIATYAATQFVCAPVLGVLSDRFGRRPVLLISMFGTGLDFFAQAMAGSVVLLFITRAINGLSGATVGVANAYVADVTTPEKRAAAFGALGAAFGIGFVLGPVIGGWLGDINIRLPFVAAGILAMINWGYGLVMLPESLPVERRSRVEIRKLNPVAAILRLRNYPVVLRLSGVMLLLFMSQFALHATWKAYTSLRYGWTPKYVGYSLACVGIGAAIVQGGLARKLIPMLGEKRSVLIGLAIGALAYLGYGLAPQGWMIYGIILIASVGAIGQPAMQAIITTQVGPKEQGSVQGALASVQNLAQIAGPLAGSALFAYFNREELGGSRVPGASFFLSAGLSVLAWVLVAFIFARRHIPDPSALKESGKLVGEENLVDSTVV